jgi:hypothetical protein
MENQTTPNPSFSAQSSQNKSAQKSSPKQKPSVLKAAAYIAAGIFVVVVFLILTTVGLINFGAPGFIQNTLTQKTGFPVRSSQFSIDALGGVVTLKDFEIDNSAQFGGGSFVKLPALNFKADVFSFTRQPYHINNVEIHLSEVTIVDNGSGLYNAKAFADALTPPNQKNSNAQNGQTNSPAPKVTIDHLLLRVDTVKIVNLKTKSTTTVTLNFKFEKNNVTDVNELRGEIAQATSLAVLKSAGPAVIGIFGKGVFGGASQATQIAGLGVEKSVEAAGTAAKKITNVATGLKDLFK